MGVIKQNVVTLEECRVLSTTYKIISPIFLFKILHMQRKLLGVISVDFDTIGQLLIIYFAFVKYSRKSISYL